MALLCEPYLLDPGPDGVHVVWHTESPGTAHAVLVGPAVAAMEETRAAAAGTGAAGEGAGWRRVPAGTVPLSRMAEDADSAVPGRTYPTVTRRPVHRHLAAVTGLAPGRTPYRVVSVDGTGRASVSAAYTLAPAVPTGTPVRLLLTSDHQLKPLVPVNLALVAETAGVALDGVLMAGDLVNVADRASDWFDDASGRAFFATLGGRAAHTVAGRVWRGAPILPHTPLFPAPGNHEVMGPASAGASLGGRFDAARPGRWDLTTYEELFPLPASADGGPRWWARTIGDVHVIALFVARMWRRDGTGETFREAPADAADPGRWGHGQFLYAPVGPGSAQYRWLDRELASPACRRARLRVVMFHHAPHGLGRHVMPAFTDPVPTVARDPATGAVTAVTYAYPRAADQLLTGLGPLLSAAGVHLVLTGHSHLWNRFRTADGTHWLETSNVGNSYGAYDRASGRSRPLPPGAATGADHVPQGDPGGLDPVVPTVAPLTGRGGAALPYVADNDVTAFSILDSGDAVVRSYRFDVRDPAAAVVLFDEFTLV
jgi:hypothetical protein